MSIAIYARIFHNSFQNLLGKDINVAYFYFAHFRIGACVPHTCTLSDMNVIVRQGMYKSVYTTTVFSSHFSFLTV